MSKESKKILTFLNNKDITLDYANEQMNDLILTSEDALYIKQCMSLLNSMTLSGEQHTARSNEIYFKAQKILNTKI